MGDLSRNFSRHEFRCKCDAPCPGKDPTVDAELVDLLQLLRDHAGVAVTVHSGVRCEDHNRSAGGASNSQHLRGRAADVTVANMSPTEVADFFAPTKVGGLGRYATFTHVDTRVLPNGAVARWSKGL